MVAEQAVAQPDRLRLEGVSGSLCTMGICSKVRVHTAGASALCIAWAADTIAAGSGAA